MQFSAKAGAPAKLTSPCLVIGVFVSANKGKRGRAVPELTPSAAAVDRASSGAIRQVLGRGGLDGTLGGTQLIYDPPGVKAACVLVVGLGAKADCSPTAIRSAAGAAARLLDERRMGAADWCLLEVEYTGADPTRRARTLVEGIADAMYRYDRTLSERKPRHLKSANLLCARDQLAAARIGINQGGAVARAVTLARNYANLPGNLCTPSWLAAQAQAMQKHLGLRTRVLGEAEMKRLGMGALLSVSRGSREPAKLITMEHRGAARGAAPVVLVGKGLTFDAGGISLKPAGAMDEMKYDMCGGASVFAAMQAAAELELPINLVGIVPSSENLPDGDANKPGDIVTAMDGTTIEVLNTDAEGRLILCDALTYAKSYRPSAVVDIATLTGACAVALGQHASGLFCDDDNLAAQLITAGEVSGDRAWRLPMWDDYAKQLKSSFADLANIGGRFAGAVTAACFLKHFTQDFPWAHLDVAGTAWRSGSNKGATGRPVPLLVEFLLNR